MSKIRHVKYCVLALALVLPAVPVAAGQPFLTDDPEPTDTGHWEIYAPQLDMDGKGIAFEGTVGAEISYGAAPNLQISVGLPVAFSHDSGGWNWGAGDVELSAKYRFYHDETAGLQIAVFPGLSLPTASNGMGAGRVTGLLPIWFQKDIGPWSVFGGGGYAINPGQGNRNYWTDGLAVTRTLSKHALIGVEVDRQGPDVIGGHGATSLGAGAIFQLHAPFRFLFSGGPVFEDGGGKPGFHAFVALGIDY